MKDTAKALATRLPDKFSTYLFDHSKCSAYWGSNPNIASCLTDFVHSVPDSYRAVGGDGKVIIAEHSMENTWAATVAQLSHETVAQPLQRVLNGQDPTGGDGGTRLATHDHGAALPQGCGPPPPWMPGGTQLAQIGGEITVNRTFLGFSLYAIPLAG